METPSITASAGFHYTPPSYLLRTSDTINRPWQGTDYEDHNDGNSDAGENEYDLPQEERPQTRRESYVDAHFHQRVRTKQNRYRDLIHQQQEQEHQAETNYYEQEQPPNNTSVEDDNDSLLRLSRTVDLHQESYQSSPSRGYRKASVASLASSGSTVTTAASSTRSSPMNFSSSRMSTSSTRRLSSTRSSFSASASSDAEARSLRSQRLRKNLLKVSDEEYDLQAKLERRRQLAREEDGRTRSLHADEYNCSASQMSSLTELPFSATSDSERERQALLQERRKLKAEREALAKTKRQAAVALREMNAAKTKAKAQAEKAEFLKKNHPKKTARQVRLDKAKKFHRVRRSYLSSTYTDCYDDSSEFYEHDPESDFAFLKDLQGIVRDTEFLQSCLTLNCCHGEEVANLLESGDQAPPLPAMVACSDQSDESGDPVPDVLLNAPHHEEDDASLDHSLRRSRIYAQFKA